MPVHKPALTTVRRAAQRLGLDLTDVELLAYQEHIGRQMTASRRLDEIPEPSLPVRYPRAGGYRPGVEENPLNAWYWKTSIPGAPSGLLAGKRVALKDNICLAGVPLMNGSMVLEGYVPEFDATVVTRILDAGGEIAGKAVCENFCLSASSHTADTGPVHNPHDPARSAGGSSSGSGALVAAGEVDIALGGDQGGSIRIPASHCGVYGLKPTWGLVPYTGIFPLELTIDHVGPLAATVTDVALCLEAIAGADGFDARQRNVRIEPYSRLLDGGVRGLRIGVLEEGFGWQGISEPDVDAAVRDAAGKLEGLGAEVRTVSLPMHRDGLAILGGILREGGANVMLHGHGQGTGWKGWYSTSMQAALSRGFKAHAKDLPEGVKLSLLSGICVEEEYDGYYYAKAQNLARVLTAAYDELLRDVDLLLMPTTPAKAPLLPPTNVPVPEGATGGSGAVMNTAPFDVTGHPALSVPCAMSEGLPVGMMLVGRNWEESTILRAAYAFEQTGVYEARPRAAVAG